MYAEKLNQFENVENLGGKAWEHAKACDLIDGAGIDDCSLHCFHYQQMFELLFKHLLETKLDRLLEQLCEQTEFKTDTEKYLAGLRWITACPKAYQYNFLLDCESYQRSVERLNPLLDELAEFSKD